MTDMPPVFPPDPTQGTNRLVLLVSDELFSKLKELAESQQTTAPRFARRMLGVRCGLFAPQTNADEQG